MKRYQVNFEITYGNGSIYVMAQTPEEAASKVANMKVEDLIDYADSEDVSTHDVSDATKGLPLDNEGKLQKWAWPGGYLIEYITTDNSSLCCACAQEAFDEEEPGYEPNLEGAKCNWGDPFLYCSGCGERIKSAYTEDEHALYTVAQKLDTWRKNNSIWDDQPWQDLYEHLREDHYNEREIKELLLRVQVWGTKKGGDDPIWANLEATLNE